MNVKKCDLCKKLIKEKPVIAGVGFLSCAELCHMCGLPILRFLKKHKLLEEENNSKSKTKKHGRRKK